MNKEGATRYQSGDANCAPARSEFNRNQECALRRGANRVRILDSRGNDRARPRRTFDPSDVGVELAVAADVLEPAGAAVEALIPVLGVPLGRRLVVHGAVGPGARVPVHQALLRGKPGEGGDRAGPAAVEPVALVRRVLEAALLARRSAVFRQTRALDHRARGPVAAAAAQRRTASKRRGHSNRRVFQFSRSSQFGSIFLLQRGMG